MANSERAVVQETDDDQHDVEAGLLAGMQSKLMTIESQGVTQNVERSTRNEDGSSTKKTKKAKRARHES